MGLYHRETHEIHNQLDMLACLEMEETEGEKKLHRENHDEL